jgi:xanthine dehydrogenase accessory factor
MRDVLDHLEGWVSQGKKVAVATVVRTERSAPRAPGAVMAISEDGAVIGSVSGGCVEPAVYEEAMEVLRDGEPKLLTYGIADEQAFEVGLTCGGTIHVFIERLDW